MSDIVVLPHKTQRAIQIGEVTGDYHFEPDGQNPSFRWRPVKWIGKAVIRTNFGMYLLHSFGTFMTICRIQRNKAEMRIVAMLAIGRKPESLTAVTNAPSVTPIESVLETDDTDLEETAWDKIARLITAPFKGHWLTRLVEGILKAQGYTTYRERRRG